MQCCHKWIFSAAEALFGIVSKQLITRKEKLFDKYHALLLEESQVTQFEVNCFPI